MTREELAKRKGMKYTSVTQTPAEAMITTPVTKSAPIEKDDVIKTAEDAPAKKTTRKSKPAPKKKVSSAPPKAKKSSAKASSRSIPKKKIEKAVSAAIEPVKNKGGRPKTRTEPVKIANIAIPESVYSKVSDYALSIYNSNLTEYINALIRKDLEKNLKKYKEVVEVLNRAKGGK